MCVGNPSEAPTELRRAARRPAEAPAPNYLLAGRLQNRGQSAQRSGRSSCCCAKRSDASGTPAARCGSAGQIAQAPRPPQSRRYSAVTWCGRVHSGILVRTGAARKRLSVNDRIPEVSAV
eukprot:3947686-Prymnesium_polylepis.1